MSPPEAPTSIDLAAFIASVLAPDANGHVVPPAWAQDLEGLPGFDEVSKTVRLTDDPARLRDEHGQELLYPGRSHPLTRKAIASVRTGRVSAARADDLSLLVTYALEVGSLLRTVFALRLYPDGTVADHEDPMSFSETSVLADGLWDRHFAGWSKAAIGKGQAQAATIAKRAAAACMLMHRSRIDREDAAALAWLERRATEIRGKFVPWIGDLFDVAATPADKLLSPTAEQRLAEYAADPSVADLKRRDAAQALAQFRSVAAGQPPIPPLSLRMLGMLMLTP